MLRIDPSKAFTLLELLVVIGIIAILAALILPALSRARHHSRSTVCSSKLHNIGTGLAMYADDYDGYMPPSRMPKIDNKNWRVHIPGGLKYRPTFLAIMGAQIGIPPFEDPKDNKTEFDREGERGDRQNYGNDAYLCPAVSTWTDERNSGYGYNYQFLGNARLRDKAQPNSYKNWPRFLSRVKAPGTTVAVADSMGTAAAFDTFKRGSYRNNSRSPNAMGNEGFNLDPPTVDPINGEVAFTGEFEDESSDGPAGAMRSNTLSSSGEGSPARSAIDPRHSERSNVLWVDGHVSLESFETLGYTVGKNGRVGLRGSNRRWSSSHRDVVWTNDGIIKAKDFFR